MSKEIFLEDSSQYRSNNILKRISIRGNRFITLLWSLGRQPLIYNAWYLISVNLVTSVAGFAFWWLAARLYTPEDIGIGSSIISAAFFISGIAELGVSIGIVRFLPESDDPTTLINTTILFVTLTSILVGLVFLFGLPYWSPSLLFLVLNKFYVAGFLIFSVASTIGYVVTTAFVARRQAQYALFFSYITSGIRLLLVILFFRLGSTGLTTAQVLATIIALTVSLLWHLPKIERSYRLRAEYKWRELSKLLPYSFGNYIVILQTQTINRILPLMVLEKMGAGSSGHFFLVWTIGEMLAAPGGALSTSAFAEGSNSPQHLKAHLNKSAMIGIGLTIPAAVIVGLGSPLLLQFFGPSYAKEASGFLRWLAATAPLTVLTKLYITQLRVQKRMGSLIWLGCILPGITLSISFGLISHLGIEAVGIGWFLGNSVMAAFALFGLKKLTSG